MGAILAITILLVFVASLAVYRTKRAQSKRDADELPPAMPPRALFDGDVPLLVCREYEDEARDEEARRKKIRDGVLRARAETGDLSALDEAHAAGDEALYRSVLDGLVTHATGSQKALRALATHVARGKNLGSSTALVELLAGEWRRGPTRAATAELLRVAALSDDASTFGSVVSKVLQSWEEGRLASVTAGELRSLFEGEYWLLSSESKRSGAGFVLKQKLADARRRLAARPADDTEAGLPLNAPAQKERP